jgi:hypothetical protein
MAVSSAAAGEADRALPADGEGFAWESSVRSDCPFPRSPSLTGLFFTGRHSDYRCGDTFYPSWASDGNLYSPWTDGKTDGVVSQSVPGLKKYLMCVTDGWPTVAKMTSYILEADVLTGPWRMVSCMPDFGEQGYFLNFPSKFISPDGRTLWLCYSANFSTGWNGVKLNFNPPGGRYGLCLHEVKLLKPAASAWRSALWPRADGTRAAAISSPPTTASTTACPTKISWPT